MMKRLWLQKLEKYNQYNMHAKNNLQPFHSSHIILIAIITINKMCCVSSDVGEIYIAITQIVIILLLSSFLGIIRYKIGFSFLLQL